MVMRRHQIWTNNQAREVKDYCKADLKRYILEQTIFRLAIPAFFRFRCNNQGLFAIGTHNLFLHVFVVLVSIMEDYLSEEDHILPEQFFKTFQEVKTQNCQCIMLSPTKKDREILLILWGGGWKSENGIYSTMLKLSGAVHSSLAKISIFNCVSTTFNVAMAAAQSHACVTKFFYITAHFSHFLDKIDHFQVLSTLA